MADSAHILVSDHGRYFCNVCNSDYRLNDPLFKQWLASACTGSQSSALSSHSRPCPVNDNFIHVGNQFIHHSHKLNVYKGFVYCARCGYRRGTNQVRLLAKPCAPPGQYGIRTLEAIQNGKLPPNLDAWPIEESSDDSSDELMLV